MRTLFRGQPDAEFDALQGPTISDAIVHPQGIVAKLIAAKTEPARMADELYLSVFNRLPSDAERANGTRYLTAHGGRKI